MTYEEQLEQCYKLRRNSLTFVIGEKGVGKSYFIHNYYKQEKNILYIREQSFKSYFLEPIVFAIEEFYNSTYAGHESINMPDNIRRELLEICKKDNIIIYFESFDSYQEDMAKFCISFFQSFLDNDKYSAFILIELDNDFSSKDKSILDKLYSLTVNTNFIKFKRKTKEELFEIISKIFNNQLQIDEKEKKYIIKSSFGNISYLFIIINYLKQEGYIYFSGDGWICKKLPKGILNKTVEDYIKHRYERLNDDLKITLQKSSLLGIEFSSVQLKDTFNILKAEEELTMIENISSLIQKNNIYNVGKFNFETEEVCNNIQSLIPEHEKKLWNKMLAQYYEVQYKKSGQNLIKRLENCCRLAIYYRNCVDIQKSVLFCTRAIRYSIYLLDYKHALELIFTIKHIPEIKFNYISLYSEIIKWEVYCYHELGKYSDAANLCVKILKNYTYTNNEQMEISYLYADSLYFIGEVDMALNELLKLKDKLQLSDANRLRYKVLSQLATVYAFYRDYGKAREYFSYSVNQCYKSGLDYDYNVQLRKSSMFWDLQLTIPLMKQAANYFEEKKNFQEIAKIYHNIGTDLLYLGNGDEAIGYLNQSLDAFQKYGSDEIHYTYNCIGVYYATYKLDFEKAILYFNKALSFKPVLFSEMVLNINIASCLKALNDDKSSHAFLNNALDIQKILGTNIPSYMLYILINLGIFAKIDGRLNESEYYFKKSLDYKLNKNQLYLVGKNLLDILPYSDNVISEYATYNVDPLYDIYYKNNICLSTLRFWE